MPLSAFAAALLAASLLNVFFPATQARVPRTWLHAHNCYPEEGQWLDRLDRALGTGYGSIAIEMDLAYQPATGRAVVSHDRELDGREPSLEDYFFRRVAPAMDAALREGRQDTWPRLVLHLDFKTNEPQHHDALWALLGKYERWLTTAVRVEDPSRVQRLVPGPLLVLTENGEGQADVFHDRVRVGDRLRLFGTLPSALPPSSTAAEGRLRAFEAAPEVLIPGPATNYRRWTNFPWSVIERGGQVSAADWTPADAVRLEAVAGRARAMGLWLRFYTLNGHAPAEGRGWTASYNFGSTEAVRVRWEAAADAGVDFIATDQYEALASLLSTRPAR